MSPLPSFNPPVHNRRVTAADSAAPGRRRAGYTTKDVIRNAPGHLLACAHRNCHAVDRPRFFRKLCLPELYRPARPGGKGFAALCRQHDFARAWRLVAAQGGKGFLEKLCAGALRRRIGRGVFHDLRRASHPTVVHYRKCVAGWRIVAGLGGLHGLDCGS